MVEIPNEVRQRLRKYGQEHVLAWWQELTDDPRRALLEQVQEIDFEQLRQLYERRDHAVPLPDPQHITPVPVIRPTQPETAGGLTLEAARKLGEAALRKGEVAALVVAGGQGSRLGFHHPKGIYPIGPVTHKSLFEIHADKIRTLAEGYGAALPLLVMTSPENDAETRSFFTEYQSFGLPANELHFFTQGTMPAVELATGKLLMESRGRIFTSPNGHGGTLTALSDSGLLAHLKERGIRHVFYFQVDNPLVRVADPVFLGYHVSARAEASSKIVPKCSPDDKVGNLVLVDGRKTIIEYSDLPAEMANQRDERGEPRFWVGSPAIHIFDVHFLERTTAGAVRLPFHVARKRVPCLGPDGQSIEPKEPNALKFEMFVFDVLPKADRWTVVETSRREEFEPLKNATGPDSPETVKQALSDLAADWLRQAGVNVPTRPDGHAAVPVEVIPYVPLGPKVLASQIDTQVRIDGPTCFGPFHVKP